MNLWQILPIEDQQKIQKTINVPDPNGGAFPKKVNLDAQVWGSFCFDSYVSDDDRENSTDGVAAQANDVPGGTFYKGNFSIDTDSGIVTFSDPVYFQAADGNWQFPDLRLRCAFSIRDPQTRAYVHFERGRQISEANTLPRYIIQDDIILNQYSSPENGPYTNLSDCNIQADYYLDAAEQEYQLTEPMSVQYNGWWPAELDGAIQSITWTLDRQQGPMMSVARNSEWGNPRVVPYKRRRQLEKLAAAQRKPGDMANTRRSLGKEGQP